MALTLYAIISKEELERLLQGKAPNFLNDLQNERYLRPPDSAEFITDLDDDPLTFQEEEWTAFFQRVKTKLDKEKVLSNQRLQSADESERLDEIIRLFALGKRPWLPGQDAQAFGGLSEDELAAEAQKRGYHLRIEVRDWMRMHELLTGTNIGERLNAKALATAQPWIEKAKRNSNFPNGCISRIEESINAMRAALQEIRAIRSISDSSAALRETDRECFDVEQAKDSIRTELLDTVLSRLLVAYTFLPQCLLKIAVMQKRVAEMGIAAFDADARKSNRSERKAARAYHSVLTVHRKYMPWKACRNGVQESSKLARMIESKIKDLTSQLRANIPSGTELAAAARIADDCIRIERLISISDWENCFSTGLDIWTESMSTADLLSMAVTGGAEIDAPVFPVTYLTIDQTRAVAKALEPLSAAELERQHHRMPAEVPDEPDIFYHFRKFYLRAANLESAVIAQFY